MPELAEVEYYRRQWDGGIGRRVDQVMLHASARVFRGVPTRRLERALAGSVLQDSQARGKQILFRFSGGHWLGLHLGMSGKLEARRPLAPAAGPVPQSGPGGRSRAAKDGAVEPVMPAGSRTAIALGSADPPSVDRHDHLVLVLSDQILVFRDPRLFGRVRLDKGPDPPAWWEALPPDLLSPEFSVSRVAGFLGRRRRSPIKAVLLMQEAFPGVGNWMADEILWRAGLHPRTPAGSLRPEEIRRLWREIRAVARGAMRTIAVDWRDLPPGWLFHVRWADGGRCPRSGAPLVREMVGGRTTCWSPALQKWRRRQVSRK